MPYVQFKVKGTLKNAMCSIQSHNEILLSRYLGAQWLSVRVLDSRPRGRGFEPHRHHYVVVLEQDTIYLSLVLVQPRKTGPCLTERLLMGRKESNQKNKIKIS